MATPTLIQILLGLVFAALGLFGFYVSIRPPKTSRIGSMFFGAFGALTVIGIALLVWQAVLAERSQAAADKATSELRREISALYELQVASPRKPTQDEVDALGDRAYVLRREVKRAGKPSLKLEAQLLSAEILFMPREFVWLRLELNLWNKAKVLPQLLTK